jgi:hypothetical protein
MNFKVEDYFQKILSTKNWKNILLRDKIRKELILNKNKINKNEINKYLRENLKQNEIIILRERLFKIVKDQYIEYILKQLSVPILKIQNCNNDLIIDNLIEFIYYIIHHRNNDLPKQCVELKQTDDFKFPLGKTFLIDQLTIIKEFRHKLIEIQIKLNISKNSTNNFYQIETNLNEYKKKYKLIELENNYLRGCLSMLIAAWIISISLVLFIK